MTVYGGLDAEQQTATVSFNIAGLEPSEVGLRLDDEYDIMCRVGLHCAPAAHRTLGTFPQARCALGWAPLAPSARWTRRCAPYGKQPMATALRNGLARRAQQDCDELFGAQILDFRRARRRRQWERFLARLTGKSADLLSYEQVRQMLKARTGQPVGLKDIPLDAIVGSVGRYTDFTRSFLPLQDETEAALGPDPDQIPRVWKGCRPSKSTRSATSILCATATTGYLWPGSLRQHTSRPT